MTTTNRKFPLLVKVCGLREAANLSAVAALHPDFMGFIFHPNSSRYVGTQLLPLLLRSLPASIRKVGVFVDVANSTILATVASFGLDGAQLHGHELPAQCAALRATGVLVIKSFSVGESFDMQQVRPYEGCCDYYLFDTKGPRPGGNGQVFDWEQLRGYDLATPYLLAGGIGLEHTKTLRHLDLPGLVGVDLNSRFETAPAIKDCTQLALALPALRMAS